jgi:hypothetical protein
MQGAQATGYAGSLLRYELLCGFCVLYGVNVIKFFNYDKNNENVEIAHGAVKLSCQQSNFACT